MNRSRRCASESNWCHLCFVFVNFCCVSAFALINYYLICIIATLQNVLKHCIRNINCSPHFLVLPFFASPQIFAWSFLIAPIRLPFAGNIYKMSRNKDRYDSNSQRRQQIFMSQEDVAAGRKSNWTGVEITGERLVAFTAFVLFADDLLSIAGEQGMCEMSAQRSGSSIISPHYIWTTTICCGCRMTSVYFLTSGLWIYRTTSWEAYRPRSVNSFCWGEALISTPSMNPKWPSLHYRPGRELLLNNNLLRVLPNEIGKLFRLNVLGLHGNPLGKEVLSIYNEPNGTNKLLTFMLDSLTCKNQSVLLSFRF